MKGCYSASAAIVNPLHQKNPLGQAKTLMEGIDGIKVCNYILSELTPQKAQQQTCGHSTTNYSGHIRSHGMHQQVV